MPRKLPIPTTGKSKIWTDLLPADGLREHGRHIYMFRNVKTNQVIYTLYPRLVERNLKQLPFIGKHSVPPSVRPDHWTPFCRVGPFPSSDQGIHALRNLHEFRQLHQLCWKDSNPEFNQYGKKVLIKRLMDQKANSVADLAQVLLMQKSKARKMEIAEGHREDEQKRFLDKRWAELEAVAKTVDEGAIKDLEKKIRDCKSLLGETKGNAKESARLNAEIKEHKQEIRTLTWTQHIVRRQSRLQRRYEAKYEEVNQELRAQRKELRDKGKQNEALLIKKPRMPLNPIRKSLLPAALKSEPKSFNTELIEIHWANLEDAEYAEKWPSSAIHDTMERVIKKRRDGFVTELEWNLDTVQAQRQQAVDRLLQNPSQIDPVAFSDAPGAPDAIGTPVVMEPQKKTGIWQYIPNLNPFNRASP
ncbi:transcriptional regulation of mitochondrial recombination-domain-containing protein [Dendryphion nanum]|uniref:Large ribosomal subunit protein mL67 n=1 Tax=Dendryphion nanum TaxID=256645 RepID=A0A9P9E902_9PLEO|nr:transcriptional regulation of mitochondrial recombination-domain-containing protein [Dendryphion nanum]